MAPRKTREEHVVELAAFGKLELLGEYEGQNVKTLYRCIEHGVEQATTPKSAARGSGLQCCRRAIAEKTQARQVAEAAATYDADLASHGKAVRLETYINSTTKILHRCLIHGEIHPASPANARKGHGLKCCQGSGSGENNPNFIRARDSYDQKIAAVGRVVRVAEYESSQKPIAHRCLEHGEIHPVAPTAALAGNGLRCCKLAGIKKATTRSTAEAAGRYDEEIAAHGKVKRLAPYIQSNAPILHRCLIHGEEHLALPSTCRHGHGLQCCLNSKRAETIEKQRLNAAATYDADLASFGFMVRLEPYVKAHTPILHRCLLHGEEQLALPTNCRKGRKLGCCRRAVFGTDTLDNALAGTHRFETCCQTSLYVYSLSEHAGYLKPGIAKNSELRASCSQGQYGVLHAEWPRPHRTLVYLPEQVLLRATRLMAHCPPALKGWPGETEVRRIEADALVAMAQELMDEIDACTNPWEFAIAHGLLNPTQEKRAQALIHAGVVSEAALTPLAA